MMSLSDTERISMMRSAVLIQSTHVTDTQTDGQTDRQTELVWHIRAIAYMLSCIKKVKEVTAVNGTPIKSKGKGVDLYSA